MRNLISISFINKIRDNVSNIKFNIEHHQKNFQSSILGSADDILYIAKQYIGYINFKLDEKNLKYEKVQIDSILDEIKTELSDISRELGVSIYIKKSNLSITSNRVWLKKALYNVFLAVLKNNKKTRTVNIQAEDGVLGIYLSIQEDGIGATRKTIIETYKVYSKFEKIKDIDITLRISQMILEKFGAEIKTKNSYFNNIITYLPYKPKDIVRKKFIFSTILFLFIAFLAISYFPIYPDKYQVLDTIKYKSYLFKSGTILRFDADAKYKLDAYKNLYNTRHKIDVSLTKGTINVDSKNGDVFIKVDDITYSDLGTEFWISRYKDTKLSVFSGIVKAHKEEIAKKYGFIDTKNGYKKTILLNKVGNLKAKYNSIMFDYNQKAIKYQILVSKFKNFKFIETEFWTLKTEKTIYLYEDGIYYVKVFAYDKNMMPSLPNTIKYLSLYHYENGLKELKLGNENEAIMEFENSISTINNNSSLPYFELAKIYNKKYQYKKSLLYINKAINIKKMTKYYILLVDNLMQLKNYKEASKILQTNLKKNRERKLLFYKSVILFYNHKFEQSQKFLFKLLEKNSHNKQYNLLMSKVLKELNKTKFSHYYKEMAK